jgi:hypothetical protein
MGNTLKAYFCHPANTNILDSEFDTLSKLVDAKHIIFGCRSPKSKGPGYWDGAFVYVYQDDSTVGVIFDDNVDYVSNDFSLDSALQVYYDYLKQEWIPMTNEDIITTARIIMRPDTIRDPANISKK